MTGLGSLGLAAPQRGLGRTIPINPTELSRIRVIRWPGRDSKTEWPVVPFGLVAEDTMPPVAPGEGTNLLNKVPAATLLFWLIKVMATTVGETGADFLIFNARVGLANTSLIMGGLLLVVLWVQLRARTYIPWLYWVAVVMVSIVGTLITDNLSDNMRVPLEVSTVAFAILLAATFVLWFVSERTLSIHTIFTRRREVYYWTAILCTFALGTAAGDLVSERFGLGYLLAGAIFGVMIATIAIAYFLFKLDGIWAFWLAYILTRPLGASFGDLVSQPLSNGGLGLGTVTTSAVFLAIIVVLVGILTASRNKLLASQTT